MSKLQLELVITSLIWQRHEHIRNDVHTSSSQAARFVFLWTWRRDAITTLDSKSIIRVVIYNLHSYNVTYNNITYNKFTYLKKQ